MPTLTTDDTLKRQRKAVGSESTRPGATLDITAVVQRKSVNERGGIRDGVQDTGGKARVNTPASRSHAVNGLPAYKWHESRVHQREGQCRRWRGKKGRYGGSGLKAGTQMADKASMKSK
jgi:hypothetical protein